MTITSWPRTDGGAAARGRAGRRRCPDRDGGRGRGPRRRVRQPLSKCSTTTGVILAVDLSHSGGPLLRSCGTTPTTGYALLNQGGWRTTGTQHDGPGFICRIGYSGYRDGTPYPTPRSSPVCWPRRPARTGPPGTPSPARTRGATANRGDELPPPARQRRPVDLRGTNISGTSGSALPPVSPARLRTIQATGTARAGSPAIINAIPITISAPASHSSPAPTILAVAIAALLGAAGITITRRRRREQS